MRTLSAALTLVLAMAVGAAWADDKGKEVRVTVLVERIHDLQLTDAQEAKIADIRKECGPKVKRPPRSDTPSLRKRWRRSMPSSPRSKSRSSGS